MKIGVSSYSFGKYMQHTGADLFRVCELAKELGFDGIEFTELPEPQLETAKKLREKCKELDLPIISYTVGADFLKGDGEVERVKGQVDVAAALGVPVMRHDACYGYKDPGYRRGWREAVAEIAPRIRKVTEYAATKGIRTCTENHGYFIQDSLRVETLIRAVDHENYGWLVDVGNFACADEDSVSAVSRAASYAVHVHAKDFLIKPAEGDDPGEGWFPSRSGNYLRGTVVGHGVIPVKQCLRILKAAGYEGYVSLEFEGAEDNIYALRAGLANLRKMG